MNLNTDFRTYTTRYFSRLVGGYMRALDGTYVRAWLPGHLASGDAGGAWDATTRMFPALAAWVGSRRGAYAMSARGEPVDVAAHVRTVFANAFDPAHPGFWGATTPHPGVAFEGVHQHTVEAASLAYAAWLLRDTVLPTLPREVLARFRDWLEYFGRTAHTNNWQLFLIVNHAARQALGWEHDPGVITRGWEIINGCERADGWMTDGPEGYFDDYNWWVFGTHELMWAQMTEGRQPPEATSQKEQAQRIFARTRKRLEEYPYFFGADGSYCEYGRSLSYKFARLALPLLAYKMGLWPHSPGMLQRLVRRHLAWYDDRGGIDRVSDTVRQELTAHGSPDVREPYINTGHPYWCMLAFAALWQIPDADPLWTCPEEPLPVEVADFTRTIKPAGWMLEGIKAGGHVLRYAIGSRHAEVTYTPGEAKYSKFCYGTHFPVNLGAEGAFFGPDAALCLTDGVAVAHPRAFEELRVAQGYLSARYVLTLGSAIAHCRTTLVPFGEICVRVHYAKVEGDETGKYFEEGASALGFSPGQLPATVVQNEAGMPALSAATVQDRCSAIAADAGIAVPKSPTTRGRNGVHAAAVVPTVVHRWTDGVFEQRFITLTLASLSGFREFWKEVSVSQALDGGLVVACGPRRVALPPELSVPLSEGT